MQNDEAVIRRHWLTPEQFTEGLAICEMLPGPASTQMGIYLGYIRAGQLGALVAGFCFIAPAFLIVLILSWGYFRFQELPQIEALFLGVSPVVVAIILAFCWRLSRKTLKDLPQKAIAAVVFLLTLLSPLSVFLQFLVAGALGIWLYRPPKNPLPDQLRAWWLPPLPLMLGTLTPEVLTLSGFWGWERIGTYFWPLLLFFLKVGSFIFGGGLVIIPLLEAEVVERLGWLTQTEFLNGVAIGQLSPGPVVLTAAFVGYKVAGVLGATVSTVGIFTPSFIFIMLASPLLLKLRQNPQIKAFLKGVTPAVLGAIAASAIPLLRAAVIQPIWINSTIASIIGILAFMALVKYKTPTWLLVPLGAILGLVATLF